MLIKTLSKLLVNILLRKYLWDLINILAKVASIYYKSSKKNGVKLLLNKFKVTKPAKESQRASFMHAIGAIDI